MAVKKKSKIKKKVVKKASSKPKKVSKAPTKNPEFEKAWKNYNSALSGWKKSLAQWQKATNETLMTYHDACQKAIESDSELLKKVSLSWENTWEEIGPEYIKQQTKMIESIFKETNIKSIKEFNVQWKKFLTVSGDDITMGTNADGNLLVADGTNFNSIAVRSLSEI